VSEPLPPKRCDPRIEALAQQFVEERWPRLDSDTRHVQTALLARVIEAVVNAWLELK
jgi:hypothetical protein